MVLHRPIESTALTGDVKSHYVSCPVTRRCRGSGDFTQNDGLSLWDSYSARRPCGRSSQNWPARNLQNSSRSSRRSRLLQVTGQTLGEALLKTRSSLGLILTQLCPLPTTAEHPSRTYVDLHGATL